MKPFKKIRNQQLPAPRIDICAAANRFDELMTGVQSDLVEGRTEQARALLGQLHQAAIDAWRRGDKDTRGRIAGPPAHDRIWAIILELDRDDVAAAIARLDDFSAAARDVYARAVAEAK